MDVRTYHTQVRPVETARRELADTLTAIDDGGTQHRANGVDPYPGVEVATYSYTEEFDDDAVPFALPPDPTELAEVYLPDNCTPFDVVDAVMDKFGKPYMEKVVDMYRSMWP